MAYKHLLLVEGIDDQYVLQNLLKHYQLPVAIADRNPIIEGKTIVIEKLEGIDKLLKETPQILKASDLERLGIIVDADVDVSARWMALRNILLRSGSVKMPRIPDPNGTIVAAEQPDRTLIVGIWIMPDNNSSGKLENFVSFLVSADDSLWKRAEQCVEQIPEEERPFSKDDQIKVHLCTWLAWQKEPGKPLGTAITAGYLNAKAPHAQQLLVWLRRLFDFETS